MSERLKVNLDQLGSMIYDLHHALRKLDTEGERSGLAADCVGDPLLRTKVHEFESKWDDRRRDIFESVDRLNVILRDTTTQFMRLETELEGALLKVQEAPKAVPTADINPNYNQARTDSV